MSNNYAVPSAIMMEFTKRQFGLSLLTATFIRLSHSAATPEQWQALNATVGGKLHLGTPVAKPCFSQYSITNGTVGSQSPDQEACDEAVIGYDTSKYITSQFGGYANVSAQYVPCDDFDIGLVELGNLPKDSSRMLS